MCKILYNVRGASLKQTIPVAVENMTAAEKTPPLFPP